MINFGRGSAGVGSPEVTDGERRHADAIKFGTVNEADYARARVRVLIGDENDPDGHLITGWLPMPGLRAAGDFEWHPLEVGERVAVLSESGELQNGVVLPAGIYCDDNPANGDKAGLWRKSFKDGGVVEYDRDSGAFLVDAVTKITLKVGGCTLVITEDGFAFSGGTITHDGVNIGKDHAHTEVEPGGGISGPPQP
jgi:phage baseplate assembly protein V